MFILNKNVVQLEGIFKRQNCFFFSDFGYSKDFNRLKIQKLTSTLRLQNVKLRVEDAGYSGQVPPPSTLQNPVTPCNWKSHTCITTLSIYYIHNIIK